MALGFGSSLPSVLHCPILDSVGSYIGGMIMPLIWKTGKLLLTFDLFSASWSLENLGNG